MFEKASRLKIRYETASGMLSVEDLWDLPLDGCRTSLDTIAITLDRKLKESDTTSFVRKTVKSNDLLKLKFDLVLRIIEVRQAEADAAERQRDSAEKKQRLLGIIAEKQDELLKGKSVEELQALVNDL